MQLLVTAEEMQRFDRAAIRTFRIPGLVLMENAGRGCVTEMGSRVGGLKGKRCVVLCGKGNNGGDGFVIARHLVNQGAAVVIGLLGKESDLREDARTNFLIVKRMATNKRSSLDIVSLHSASQLRRLPEAHVIVDAIFGTGFSGAVRGIYLAAIEWINRQKTFVCSVDIPSGIDASTGTVQNIAVEADMTVTMGLAKIGHYVGEGRDHSGEVRVVDISIPAFVFAPDRCAALRVHAMDVSAVLPRRPLSAHKYSVGKVFVVGGSRGLTGAPFMSAQSALRTGAGAVILGVPRSVHPIIARKVTEVMVSPLDETDEGSVSCSAREAINEKVAWADVVVIGPGLSRNAETQALVLDLVRSVDKPLVLDADGLNAVSTRPDILKKRRYPTVLTPHVRELARLIHGESGQIERYRLSVARQAARKLGSVVALKGAPTITSSDAGDTYVNSTGNPGMATAGSGDVLTGIIASLIGQGMPPTSATYSGVFLHGLAGDIGAGKLGQQGLMAMDILENIPHAMGMLNTVREEK
jgi:hydroxyethylthiazole kinase-like uncharacterized protein yjeF